MQLTGIFDLACLARAPDGRVFAGKTLGSLTLGTGKLLLRNRREDVRDAGGHYDPAHGQPHTQKVPASQAMLIVLLKLVLVIALDHVYLPSHDCVVNRSACTRKISKNSDASPYSGTYSSGACCGIDVAATGFLTGGASRTGGTCSGLG